MASLDVGIDLGTATVIVYIAGKGIVLKEPSVVAVNTNTGKILSIGEEAHKMLGKTPGNITAVKPMADGVIADYLLTEQMIKYFLGKVTRFNFVRPRLALCVPSGITEVESRAVIEAARSAGARSVYLIEEPVAAAIGAGIDITRPNGIMIVDIGGGTTDVAVISLGGIVNKESIKVAGNKFDEVIAKFIKEKYKVIVGDKSSEMVKIHVSSVSPNRANNAIEVKGHNYVTGLPNKIEVKTEDTYDVLCELAEQITSKVQSVLETTPPELVGDIYSNGIIMTGGGSLLGGLSEFISERIKVGVNIANDPINCVALGTGKSFEMSAHFREGFEIIGR